MGSALTLGPAREGGRDTQWLLHGGRGYSAFGMSIHVSAFLSLQKHMCVPMGEVE